jgi:hypothetical protein
VAELGVPGVTLMVARACTPLYGVPIGTPVVEVWMVWDSWDSLPPYCYLVRLAASLSARGWTPGWGLAARLRAEEV